MSPPKMKAESRYRNCLNRAATSGITPPFSVITAGGSASLMLHGAICSMSASDTSRPQPASTAMTAAFRMAYLYHHCDGGVVSIPTIPTTSIAMHTISQ
jgi:hypothetical protein